MEKHTQGTAKIIEFIILKRQPSKLINMIDFG